MFPPDQRQGTLSASLFSLGLLTALTGCIELPASEGQTQGQSRGKRTDAGPAAVDVAVARSGSLAEQLEYIGTTQPNREVLLRSQVDGQILTMTADVGDVVAPGQVLARLESKVLTTAVLEAQAQVAALESDVAQARTQVSDALNQVERSRLELQQAQADRDRYEQLGQAGAIARQQVEQARTAVGTIEQAFKSAQQVVQTRQQAVAAAQRRVVAQQAVVARERERLSYAIATAPIAGVVLTRLAEPGNLAQPGSELYKLGDFSQVKVAVQISELGLAKLRVGQSAQISLDAFPKAQFQGRIARISPVADATARLVPIEVTLPNPQGQIGSGLLARVRFGTAGGAAVVVPERALQPNGRSRSNSPSIAGGKAGVVFTVARSQPSATVAPRQVILGDRRDGQVEILSGLAPGDRVVVRSNKPLKAGDAVRFSILSEGVENKSHSVKQP